MRQRVLLEIDEPTVSNVLDHLFGKNEYDNPDYVIYRYEESRDRSFMQRFNSLWVFPIFIISIPIQWLMMGQIGISRHTKLGRIVNFLVGFDA